MIKKLRFFFKIHIKILTRYCPWKYSFNYQYYKKHAIVVYIF